MIRCPLLFGPSVLVLETLTREKFPAAADLIPDHQLIEIHVGLLTVSFNRRRKETLTPLLP